ncbi:hypothetical protein CYMTET_10467 [Cymbomonas tetramitiformis]|uniref:EamA domain-containing protein n=1 Tax=Cymbomonas tetramitiformis TaxID=36881 RepID=A0AAE0GPG3_9CHLO|nr:hypothetical protein CYMTET_10467 [Cymbomonas tetramitiformis]
MLLLVYVVGYVLAAASEIWAIKEINYNFYAQVPTLSAMMLNSYWPIQALIYWRVRQTQEPPERDGFPWYAYTVLGFSAGSVSTLRSIGINELDGVIYVICSNTEVIFSAVLSVLVLKKRLNVYQISAVLLVLGAVIFAVWDPSRPGLGSAFDKARDSEHGQASHAQTMFIAGVTSTLASRLLSALNSILAEWFLGKNKKSTWCVQELPLVTAIVPSVLLPWSLIITKENTAEWGKLTRSDAPGHAWGLIYFILLALSMAKLVDRQCKMNIIAEKSAVFFEGVDAMMKSVAGLGAYVFFYNIEKVDTKWNDFIAMGVIVLALGLTTYGEQVEKRREKYEQKFTLEEGQLRSPLLEGGGEDN